MFHPIKKVSLLSILLLGFSILSFGQTRHALSGLVLDSASRESLPGAQVLLKGSYHGAITNNYGHYSLQLPAGEHTLEFSYVGYRAREITLQISGDTIMDVLLVSDNEIERVVIAGEASRESSKSPSTSTHLLPKQAISHVPLFFGERDVMKVIQLLPGVQTGGEGSGNVYIRGGGPDQNLIILDDAPIYNVNHLLGMFSLFSGEAIKSTELIKGGFPARYGGRLSSVIEMVMEDGNMQSYHGSASLGLIAAKASIQGPIVKDKASFLLTGRRTYADLLLRPFFNKEDGVPILHFYDLTGKVNWRINSRHRLFLSGYFGEDAFGFSARKDRTDWSKSKLGWGNGAITLRWNYLSPKGFFCNTAATYSMYNLRFRTQMKWDKDEFLQQYLSRIQNVGLKWDFSWPLPPSHLLRAGASWTGYQFEPKAITEKISNSEIDHHERVRAYSIESALYAEDQMRFGRWLSANAGFRLSYYASPGHHQVSAEPRVSAALHLHPQVALKGSFAMMGQHLHLLTSSGLGLPSDLWVPATKQLPIQRGWSTALGVTYDVEQIGSALTLEGYYKQSRGVIHYKEGASHMAEQLLSEAQGYYWENQVTRGNAWSAGLEVLFQRKVGSLTGWLAYTLSFTRMHFKELNLGEPFWAPYDRRHDISIVLMWEIGKGWSISGAWVFNTGRPFALPENHFTATIHPDPLYEQQNAQHRASRFISATKYSAIDAYRMLPYHRLDLGVQWEKQAKHTQHTLSLDIYNTYNRKNPYFYTLHYESNASGEGVLQLYQVSLFPIIPTITYTLKF